MCGLRGIATVTALCTLPLRPTIPRRQACRSLKIASILDLPRRSRAFHPSFFPSSFRSSRVYSHLRRTANSLSRRKGIARSCTQRKHQGTHNVGTQTTRRVRRRKWVNCYVRATLIYIPGSTPLPGPGLPCQPTFTSAPTRFLPPLTGISSLCVRACQQYVPLLGSM